MESENKSKHSEDEVKSNTLIKFESISARQFSTLPAAVDLKRPPSNWLNGQIKFTPNMSNCYKFTSFKMAFDFWHELGDVDVISDSENIKNLLKMPYADGNVLSYFVHRIGNTLLIDQFDLQKYLLWKSEEDWKWLRAFIYENIQSQFKNNRRPFAIQHKSHEVVHQKNLLSKFLYYSIEDSNSQIEEKKFVPSKVPQLSLPQPKQEDISDLPDRNQFSRNILWTFEDIRMLIGSDMQIFGNASRPCISLRLRDMKKPINVLTGIDYWLDNLMCNVPEIFLCFHQDGIVQKYEHVKTEDLPHMENSKFSPKVIRNVAQNILSFLKSNATKAGHTYWLFKAKNDDVVKLYDLTTLQEVASTKEDGSESDEKKVESEESEEDDNDQQNPFTIPVAMLLYTLARNLKYSKEKLTSKQAGNIKQLLDNCLKLLPKEKYPQIAISSHYILSDIQIQAGIDISNPSVHNFEDDESDSDEFYEDGPSDDEDDVDLSDECYSAMQSISDAVKESKGYSKKQKPQPLKLGTIQERSKIALENVISGLGCLEFFGNEPMMAKEKKKEKQQIIHEELNPNLANPEIPIPMGWSGEESKKSRKKSKKKDSETATSSSSSETQINSKSLLMKGAPNVKTLNTHLKVLLYEKASLTYACLAEDSYNSEKFGATLYFLEMSIVCQNLVTKYVPVMSNQKSCLYGRAGDCYFQISKQLEKIDDFVHELKNSESDLDKEIIKELEKDEITKDKFKDPVKDMDEMLEASCVAYEKSLSFSEESKYEHARRLGSVYNELGVHLMHKAEKLYHERHEKSEDDDEEDYNQVAKKSYSYLKKAVDLFEFVKDTVNTVICNLNLGRFFRLSAHINIFNIECPAKASMFIQKKMYQESFDSYNKALAILVNRKNNPDVWDMVKWELSTATFTLAKQMLEHTPVDGNTDELEKEALEMLMKALKLCDLETNSARTVLYIFRAGLIHHKLGSFYHHQLRKLSDDSKRKTTLQVCRLNYEKSINLLQQLKEFKDYFQVQIERIALQEFLADESSNHQLKVKNYQTALTIFLECSEMMKLLLDAKTIVDEDETMVLVELFETRLQHVLKMLTKITMLKKSDSKSQIFKKMFSFTLRPSQKLEFSKLVSHLSIVLENIKHCDFKP